VPSNRILVILKPEQRPTDTPADSGLQDFDTRIFHISGSALGHFSKGVPRYEKYTILNGNSRAADNVRQKSRLHWPFV
jgi:hypothetical protein